jgi:hypothetical protein
MYSNALSGLASGMASGGGAPMGGDMAMGGMGESEMVPCPLCQGTGMIPADMMGGEPMLPPRLAARGGGMPMGGDMGGMSMGGAMPMGGQQS